MTEMNEKNLMAGLLKAIEVQTGITFHDENIRYFFEQWKQDIEQWRETAPDEAHGSLVDGNGEGVGIAVAYSNKAMVADQSIESLAEIEKAFGKWNREQNPVNIMTDDLRNRGCSKATIATYKSVGNTFMRLFDYQPEFSLAEYNEFMRHYETSAPGSRRTYRDILKLFWEVQGLVFPLKERRMHAPHNIMPSIPPMFSAKQVAHIIKAVKFMGTPEEKYYFCMATVFAPRRIELCEITAKNFIWNGKTGTLTFNPHKHGVTRHHCIPEELVPYIKEYSYQVKPMTDANLTRKFWLFVNHLGLPVPKLSKKEKQELREKRQRPRQYGWHAFRHGLTTSLLEVGISDTMVNRWLGWRSGSQANPMVNIYYNPQDLDNKIQQKHPFIRMWKS